MQWNFFYPSVIKSGSIPSCCIHHFLEFLEVSLATCCVISAFFFMAPTDHRPFQATQTVSFVESLKPFLRAGCATATQSHTTLKWTPASAQSPRLRKTCVHKSAFLWLTPMQSSLSSFEACTHFWLWVAKSGGPLRLLVLCTSTIRATMIPPIPYYGDTQSSGSICATAHPQAANPSTISLEGSINSKSAWVASKGFYRKLFESFDRQHHLLWHAGSMSMILSVTVAQGIDTILLCHTQRQSSSLAHSSKSSAKFSGSVSEIK